MHFAEADLVVLKLSIQDEDRSLNWQAAATDAYLARYKTGSGKEIAEQIALAVRRLQPGLISLQVPTSRLGDDEWVLVVKVDADNAFPYGGELRRAVNKKELAKLKTPLTLKLKKRILAQIRVYVLSADGKPAADELILLWRKTRTGASTYDERRTNGKGVVTFQAEPKHEYILKSGRPFSVPNSNFGEIAVSPSMLEKGELILVRFPAPQIKARLTGPDKSDIAKNITCSVDLVRRSKDYMTIRRGHVEKGYLRVWGIEPGKYELSFPRNGPLGEYKVRTGSALIIGKPDEKAPSAEIELEERSQYSLTISVKNSENRWAIAGATLRLRGYDLPVIESKTDKDGVAKVKSLPEGLYSVEISADGFAFFSSVIQINRNTVEAINLRPLRNVTVTVKDIVGQIVKKATVVFVQYRSGKFRERLAKNTGNGTFVVSGIEDGNWFVIVDDSMGRIRYVGPLKVNGDMKASVSMMESVEVSGTIKSPAKLKGYRVVMVPQAARLPLIRDVAIDINGGFVAQAVPGRFDIYLEQGEKFVPLGELDIGPKAVKLSAAFSVSAKALQNPLSQETVFSPKKK